MAVVPPPARAAVGATVAAPAPAVGAEPKPAAAPPDAPAAAAAAAVPDAQAATVPPTAIVAGIFKGHTDKVTAVAWVGDGRLVSASTDGTLKLWSVAEQRVLGTFKGHRSYVTCVCWLGDDRIASAGGDNTARIWDLPTQRCLKTLVGDGYKMQCVAWLGGDRLVTASYKLSMWSVETGACLEKLTVHHDWVRALVVLGAGARIVSASTDKTLKLWDVAARRCVGTFAGHTDAVYDVVSAGGDRIVSASHDITLKLWSVDTQHCLGTFNGHTGWVCGVAVLRPDNIISCSKDKTLRVWNVNTLASCSTVAQTAGATRILALSNDHVVTCSGSVLNLLELAAVGVAGVVAGCHGGGAAPDVAVAAPDVAGAAALAEGQKSE